MSKLEVLTARILIVDDDPQAVALLEKMLSTAGYDSVRSTTDAREAAGLYQQFRPDLILLDLTMPHLDGFQVMKQLREMAQDDYLSVLVLTASSERAIRLRALESGAKDFLTKPVDRVEALTRIRNLLEVHLLHIAALDLNRVLEDKVQERTEELRTTNLELQAEIAERARTERELEHSRAELRNLTAHLHLAREEERTRIGREIHDELGQVLTALQMDLFWLNNRLTGRQEALRDKVGVMSRLLDTTLEAVQRIVAELRPVILELGLSAAIEWEVQGFQERAGIPCEREIDPEETTMDPACALAVFRILQESLTNVARHANASQVLVRWKPTASHLILEVRDNGKGVTEEQLSQARSLGLLGMRERALAWGGEVTIRNGIVGKGTVVTTSIPVPAGAE